MKNKILKRNELKLVDPKFRNIVLDAWKKGERVPYGVVYLSSKKPTKKDIERAKEIISELDFFKNCSKL